MGTTHLGAPGPPGATRCLVLTSGLPSGTSLAHWVSSGPEKISKKFCYVWSPFGTGILRSKKQAKTASGTGHYVNRFVSKNDRNLL